MMFNKEILTFLNILLALVIVTWSLTLPLEEEDENERELIADDDRKYSVSKNILIN